MDALRKRFERERKARREAEEIAEQVTGQLYATSLELRDVNTELTRANDELQGLNQALRDFVAVASHDLRNPITAILGWAQTVSTRWDSAGDDLKRQCLEIVQREALRMSRLVEDLLTLSRLEAGALDTHADVVALRGAVEDVIQGHLDAAPDIKVVVAGDPVAVVDSDHLQRILQNYVGNALKYGAPPIEVDAIDAGEWVEIRVRDCGDGVPEDFVPRLFGRFARADTESTRVQKGSGLGLSIVQGLAQANGGDTWYEPNTPKGSCFVVRLRKAA